MDPGITVNGESRALPIGTLLDLLRAEGLDPARRGIAVAVNGAVVPPTSEVSEDGWVTYRPGQYRAGDNSLSFRVTARDAAREKEVSVRSVELHVAYR